MADNTKNMDIIEVIESVEDFLIEKGHVDEFKNELDLFKIRQVSFILFPQIRRNILFQPRIYFQKIKLSPDFKLGEYYLRIYNLVLESNDYVDYLNKFYFNKFESAYSQINGLTMN